MPQYNLNLDFGNRVSLNEQGSLFRLRGFIALWHIMECILIEEMHSIEKMYSMKEIHFMEEMHSKEGVWGLELSWKSIA